MQTLSESAAYTAIARTLDGNYEAIAKLHARHPSWLAAWNTLAPTSPINPLALWTQCERAGIRLLLAADFDFPPLLREIPNPPFAIYMKGTLPRVDPCIAIVGTRRASPAGKTIARQFAQTLSRACVPIVSGLALGIDAEAHLGALEGGAPTVAVLACGLDAVYPRQHTTLAKRIIAHGGALISEYAPGTPAYPAHFLERNRIVAGLSRGALIVEAPLQSGALATSRFALEQNRDVFVVPGPITHPNYIGSLGLLKSGAILVTTADDILREYNIAPLANTATAIPPSLAPNEQTVYRILAEAHGALAVDQIVACVTLSPQVVSRILSTLVLQDVVVERAGNYSLPTARS